MREIIYFFTMISALVLFLTLKKNLNRSFNFIGIFLVLNVPLELYALYIIKTDGMGGNYFIYHFQMPLEFLCISLYFFREIKFVWLKQILGAGTLVCVLVCIMVSIALQPLNQDNSIATLLCNLLLTCWSVINIFDMFRQKEERRFYGLHRFWLSLACLVYYPGNMLINAMIGWLYASDPIFANNVWTFDYLLNTALYFFIALAIWKNYQENTAGKKLYTAMPKVD